ncbi:spermidine/putrescine transport system substrate-binding protein [Brevibacterium sanguinis]|uniref:Spermidine/putrescine transport system substrate-binding protein n=2 Tax=Brevibacterium TaxID=1696 RepID=A0A366ICG9_9MICO|nr:MULTISPECIES: spermidine/putrescine ABC transporter substrate-binding protein [Brevibacterium]RBP61481.1 spermidine/putrescine transport system substrate-binding protein [Brevibacterium sanguinis]RBP68542.1 spermidine/putrescine transport system substrate-binding protein [Brevibacterium celere]
MTNDADVRFLAPRTAAARLSRRALLAGFGVAGLGALSACSRTTKMAASPALDGELESKLNLYTWGDYDNPALIDAFKSQNDVLVQVDSYGSNEELIAKLATSRGTSGYDVVVPTGSNIPKMLKHNLLQELDFDLIPNFEHVDPNFTHQYFDPENKYSVCKAWGTTGYVYDTTKISRDMTSWQDFIDVAQDEAAGTTSLLEDPWEVAAIALAALGYSLNTEDEAELEEARTLILEKIAPNTKAYIGNVATGMIQGSFTLLQAFNGDARQGMSEVASPENWKFVFPTPSANLWMDCWALATGAPHPDAAHAFINHMLSPNTAIDQLDYIGYPIGIKGLEELAAGADLSLPELIFPTQEVLDRLEASKQTPADQIRTSIFADAQARSGA